MNHRNKNNTIVYNAPLQTTTYVFYLRDDRRR